MNSLDKYQQEISRYTSDVSTVMYSYEYDLKISNQVNKWYTYKLEASTDEIKSLAFHLYLLFQKNLSVKLTSITSTKDLVLKHTIDSLQSREFIQDPNLKICDLGTGGGFPGLPLAILNESKFVLIDSIGKKIKCVDLFIKQLNLSSRVLAVASRSENFAKEHSSEFDVVVSRAVAALGEILELCAPLIKIGGRTILYRAETNKTSLEKYQSLFEYLGFELEILKLYKLDDIVPTRSVVVLRKVKEPQIILPRREGMAKKKPLVKKFGIIED